MEQYLKYFSVLIILFVFTNAKSQIFTFDSSYLSGELIEDSTGKEIAFAHIYNESRRQGFITNEEGKFRIPAGAGDTLVLSALGFYAKVVFLSNTSIKQYNIIKLKPQVYEIEEVSVRMFKDYEDFKRQFIALELPKTQTDNLRNNLTSLSRKEAIQADYERQVKEILENPGVQLFSASVPIRSREERQLINYAEVLKKEERQRVIDKKYNREIIFEITHLTEDEITEFMGFCNFSEEYLFEASEYEILVEIEQKYKEYKLWKESGSFHLKYLTTFEKAIS